MILVYGRADDPPLKLVRDSLADQGVPFTFLDQAYIAEARLSVAVDMTGMTTRLSSSRVPLDLTSVTAVYARLLDVATTSDELATARAQAFQQAFVEWLDLTPALVVNRPAAMDSNSSKPYQAQLLAREGLRCPDTLVTNDPDALSAFVERHRRVIYKSVSGVRSVVRELSDADVARLNRVRHLPVQFQEYVEGTDVRVHVVGDEVFAADITSTATDYRYAHKSGTTATVAATSLPDDIAAACIRAASALQLPLCGIDLRCDAEGNYVCFEANPMPAFSYYESHTGLPIAHAIARLLTGASHG